MPKFITTVPEVVVSTMLDLSMVLMLLRTIPIPILLPESPLRSRSIVLMEFRILVPITTPSLPSLFLPTDEKRPLRAIPRNRPNRLLPRLRPSRLISLCVSPLLEMVLNPLLLAGILLRFTILMGMDGFVLLSPPLCLPATISISFMAALVIMTLFASNALPRIRSAVMGFSFPLSPVLTITFPVVWPGPVPSLSTLVMRSTDLRSPLTFTRAPVEMGIYTILLFYLLGIRLHLASRRRISLGDVLGPLTPPTVITMSIFVVPVRPTVLTARGTTLLLVVIMSMVTLAVTVFSVSTDANVVRLGALRKATTRLPRPISQVFTRRATLFVLALAMEAPSTVLRSEAPLRLMRFTIIIMGLSGLRPLLALLALLTTSLLTAIMILPLIPVLSLEVVTVVALQLTILPMAVTTLRVTSPPTILVVATPSPRVRLFMATLLGTATPTRSPVCLVVTSPSSLVLALCPRSSMFRRSSHRRDPRPSPRPRMAPLLPPWPPIGVTPLQCLPHPLRLIEPFSALMRCTLFPACDRTGPEGLPLPPLPPSPNGVEPLAPVPRPAPFVLVPEVAPPDLVVDPRGPLPILLVDPRSVKQSLRSPGVPRPESKLKIKLSLPLLSVARHPPLLLKHPEISLTKLPSRTLKLPVVLRTPHPPATHHPFLWTNLATPCVKLLLPIANIVATPVLRYSFKLPTA